MGDLFSQIRDRLKAGEAAVLCRIVDASGSTPRGAGARMAVFRDGSTAGTIGGGAVELRAARLAAELLETGGSRTCSFHLTPGDIEDIGMVINYDVPHDPEDYIHRIGRTARASATGRAVTFVNEEEQGKFHRIEEFIEREVPKLPLPEQVGEGPKYNPSAFTGRKGRGRGRNNRGGRNKEVNSKPAAGASSSETTQAQHTESRHGGGRGEGNRGSRDRHRRRNRNRRRSGGGESTPQA